MAVMLQMVSQLYPWFEIGVEALPDDMQRNISQMRELDLHYQGMNLRHSCWKFNKCNVVQGCLYSYRQ